jgi:hypothetical protein
LLQISWCISGVQECKEELAKERCLASSFGAPPGSSSAAEITIASSLITACKALRDSRCAEEEASEELTRSAQGTRKLKQATAEADIVSVVAQKLKHAADSAQVTYQDGGVIMPDVKKKIRQMYGIASSTEALAKEMVAGTAKDKHLSEAAVVAADRLKGAREDLAKKEAAVARLRQQLEFEVDTQSEVHAVLAGALEQSVQVWCSGTCPTRDLCDVAYCFLGLLLQLSAIV